MDELYKIIKDNIPDVSLDTIKSIVEIMEPHFNDKDNGKTATISLFVLIELANRNPNLKFSYEYDSEKYLHDKATYKIKFSLTEYSLIGDPFVLIEHSLIQEIVKSIEYSLNNKENVTLIANILIYNLYETLNPHSFTAEFKYKLQS